MLAIIVNFNGMELKEKKRNKKEKTEKGTIYIYIYIYIYDGSEKVLSLIIKEKRR